VEYAHIIEEQRKKLSREYQWWPLYFYHFTDVHNALNIIEKEYIYGRKIANEENLMNSENASSSVINITNSNVKNYARLYMRPKTPTQYHNEGYKPKNIRNQEIDANCPVPIFFLLDAEKTLLVDGVKFVEKGFAGNLYEENNLLSGVENYANLKFDKIFHSGSFPSGSDIKQYRHTEIIRRDGIPISRILKGIVCRSIAEKQTLIYLLKKISLNKYEKYKRIISFKPEIDLFYGNGIFIKNVKMEDNILHFELNDASRRFNANNANGKDIFVEIIIEWLDYRSIVKERKMASFYIDYGKTQRITYRINRELNCNRIAVEIKFDDFMMYQNIIQTESFEIE
jgi:hypothetical protein